MSRIANGMSPISDFCGDSKILRRTASSAVHQELTIRLAILFHYCACVLKSLSDGPRNYTLAVMSLLTKFITVSIH